MQDYDKTTRFTGSTSQTTSPLVTLFDGISKPRTIQLNEFGKNFNDMSTTNFQVVLSGDTAKPLSLIKSFKWLATSEDIASAENFVSTLPPADPESPNATLEELLAAQAEAERIANENIFQKAVRKTGEFFVNFKKDKK